MILAFLTGGSICELGYLIQAGLMAAGTEKEEAGTWSVVILICMAQIATGLGWYNTLGKIAGAGSAVPITGFANSVVSPAMEYKKEGYCHGRRSKNFQPVRSRSYGGFFSFRCYRCNPADDREIILGGRASWRKKSAGE